MMPPVRKRCFACIFQDNCRCGQSGAAVAASLFQGPSPAAGVPAARGCTAGESVA